MHAKSDSDVTCSVDASTPPRSPRRPLYYVQSPSHVDAEKTVSYASSPAGSPAAHHYHCSPIHHSRESSTSRFSAPLRSHRAALWKAARGRGLLDGGAEDDDDEEDDDGGGGGARSVRFYLGWFLVCFVAMFSGFSLILWGASKSYSPHVHVKRVVIMDFTVQAGIDQSGVPTDMLSLNSTVKIYYRNRATFFGVHVTSTPLELYFFNLKVASGQIKKFYQLRKSERVTTTIVQGYQVPLYGGLSSLSSAREGDMIHKQKVRVGFNLTFTVRSRAYILGKLVKSKFYTRIRCPVTLDGTKIGKRMNMAGTCSYR